MRNTRENTYTNPMETNVHIYSIGNIHQRPKQCSRWFQKVEGGNEKFRVNILHILLEWPNKEVAHKGLFFKTTREKCPRFYLACTWLKGMMMLIVASLDRERFCCYAEFHRWDRVIHVMTMKKSFGVKRRKDFTSSLPILQLPLLHPHISISPPSLLHVPHTRRPVQSTQKKRPTTKKRPPHPVYFLSLWP